MIEINGIYNIDTIKVLEDIGVRKFSFDCRPRNFNFIQLHAIKEIAKEISKDSSLGLLFEDEQIIGIKRIVEEVKEVYTKDLDLYFYGANDSDYYKDIPYDFYWNFESTYNFNHFYENHHFKGFIVNYNDVAPLADISKQLDFLKSLGKDKKIKIQLDWNSEIQESLFDFYEFDSIVLEVNNLVESSFRNIDLLKFRDHLQKLTKQLGS